ncbi:hypothetical protein Rhopal_003936-T1 [Rhodotorula paludigena]|uniref:SET domain-containing protein n=1 Tax=Rhodotorula paludigena TaxID=86838 RepID=A0AAV5GPH8_9BASI|nr:hypothetical protein Rhopal_003936-T1 [Rhodotorula paludigena]
MPKLDSCTASLILGHPVEEDTGFASSPRPRRKVNPEPSKWYKKHALLPTKSESYKPCANYGRTITRARGGLRPVKRHELVGLYGGEQFPQELGDNPTMESRWGFWRSAFVQLEKQSYWFDVDEGTAADSTLLGNAGRFINGGHQNSDGTTVGPRPNLASKTGDELIMDYGPLYTTLPLPTKP